MTSFMEFMLVICLCLSLQGVWVRQGAVGFLSAVASSLNIADVHCNLIPLIQPYIKQNVIQVDKEVISG